MYYYLIAMLVIGLDQWTKWLVVRNMELGQSLPIVEGFLYLTSHRNRGAAFGILQGQQWLFVIVTILVIIGILYMLRKIGQQPWMAWGLSLVLGGAIGNFIDRVRMGEVVDFMDVRIFSYHYPIFNVADSAVVIGVILLIIDSFRSKQTDQESVQ